MALEVAIELLNFVSMGKREAGMIFTMLHQIGPLLAYTRQVRSMRRISARNTGSLAQNPDLQWSHCTFVTEHRRMMCPRWTMW